MSKKIISLLITVLALCLISTVSYAAESETSGKTVKSFWQKLFNYPAKATEESVNVVSDAAKGGTAIVTDEVKRVGQVTSGEVDKTKELVTEPLVGAATTAKNAVEGTVNVPVKAAKE